MTALGARGRVVIEIEKRLPVQGGLGGASGNAVAALLALERALKKKLPAPERLRISAEVGSDLPLFLVGGTVLGVGRGEEVYPLTDVPSTACVIVTPEIGVSTPGAFADWDLLCGAGAHAREKQAERARPSFQEKPAGLRSAWTAEGGRPHTSSGGPTSSSKLTASDASDRMSEFGRTVSAWLSGSSSGVPVIQGGGRAETPLLDLVRTGIENDFERVVFPKYPELREAKSVLERAGAFYASLCGSGSAIYGLFASRMSAERVAARTRKQGLPAVTTTTLTRPRYWKHIFG
jgi:4-diphosphocytidyl-2-C-methyl-D-erythritol kinase